MKYKNFNKFCHFARIQLQTKDIDPQFCLLDRFYKMYDVPKKHRLWHTLIYLTWYHFGSAEEIWRLYPEQRLIKKQHILPTGKNRRLFRGTNKAVDYLNGITDKFGDVTMWAEKHIGDGGKGGWVRAREAFEGIHSNGPWSSYKWCDMLKFVHHYPITAPDIGDKKGLGAGPIAGLASLTGLSWQECADKKIAMRLYRKCKHEHGISLNGLDQLESILCNWQGVIGGRYYTGHDIDRDQSQLLEDSKLWRVRPKVYDECTLGENKKNKWHGIRKEFKVLYRDEGVIYDPYKSQIKK